jgi:ribonuclease HII
VPRSTVPEVLLLHERHAWSAGKLLVGVDEVGRGPLAGPVVAAAVVFVADHPGIVGVRDSKQVKRRAEREHLARQIRSESLAWGVGAASVGEIARYNIRRATALAMHRAVATCRARLADPAKALLLVDGRPVPELGFPHKALVKGDANCHAIAAGAILAKVIRDNLMVALSERRPGYGWETNSGYGSSKHIEAIRRLGMTPHHREQFCRTAVGQGELF